MEFYESRTRLDRYARFGLWALPVWSALLLIGTWNRQPDPGTDFPAYAEFITTTWFLISHLVASILGAAIGIIGLIALFILLSSERTLRMAAYGLVAFVVGSVLVTSVFGAAAFAQPAIGNAYLDGQTAEAVAFDSDVYGPALFATALPGLFLFTVGIVLFGIAVVRSGFLPRGAGYTFALAGVLFGLIGFVVSEIQTVGAVLLIGSTFWIAYAESRSQARHVAPLSTEPSAKAAR